MGKKWLGMTQIALVSDNKKTIETVQSIVEQSICLQTEIDVEEAVKNEIASIFIFDCESEKIDISLENTGYRLPRKENLRKLVS